LAGDTTAHAFLWRDGVMTDLGTLSGDVFSFASGMNNMGQVVGQSCDQMGNCRAFLWENGVMTDLNTLIPSGSSLFLISGGDINDRGEIAGQAYDPNTGDLPAFLAIPEMEPSAVPLGANLASHVSLPDNVRKLLQRRMKIGPFGRGR
jgi:probable HAF family extracellular repeat protein